MIINLTQADNDLRHHTFLSVYLFLKRRQISLVIIKTQSTRELYNEHNKES